MAADIFAQGLDRDVDTVRDRREEEGRRPGIVEYARDPAPPGHRGDPRDVLNLEAVRARAFHEDRAGGIAQHRLQRVGAGQRVVVTRRDSEPRQHLVAEAPRRSVGAVDHQQLVAGAASPVSVIAVPAAPGSSSVSASASAHWVGHP